MRNCLRANSSRLSKANHIVQIITKIYFQFTRKCDLIGPIEEESSQQSPSIASFYISNDRCGHKSRRNGSYACNLKLKLMIRHGLCSSQCACTSMRENRLVKKCSHLNKFKLKFFLCARNIISGEKWSKQFFAVRFPHPLHLARNKTPKSHNLWPIFIKSRRPPKKKPPEFRSQRCLQRDFNLNKIMRQYSQLGRFRVGFEFRESLSKNFRLFKGLNLDVKILESQNKILESRNLKKLFCLSFQCHHSTSRWYFRVLTHNRRHFTLCQLGHRASDGNLQRRDVESCHIVFAAAFIVVVDDILPHVVVGAWILDVRLPSSAVHDEHQDQYYGRAFKWRLKRENKMLAIESVMAGKTS